jgi:hypothetical protein
MLFRSYFSVEWDPSLLSWADFRGKVIGCTNPADAAPGSLRGRIYAGWDKGLGLGAAPNGGDNGVHGSASPLEGARARALFVCMLFLALSLSLSRSLALSLFLCCFVSIYLSFFFHAYVYFFLSNVLVIHYHSLPHMHTLTYTLCLSFSLSLSLLPFHSRSLPRSLFHGFTLQAWLSA